MRTSLLLLCIGLAPAAVFSAEAYRPVAFGQTVVKSGDIQEISSLKTEFRTEIKDNWENRYLIVHVGLKVAVGECEDVNEVTQTLGAQGTDSEGRYYQDSRITALTQRKPCEISRGFGPPQFVRFPLRYWIDQRPATERGKPWPSNAKMFAISTQYLSFDLGMHNFALYSLDFRNINAVKFTAEKNYQYVRGESIPAQFR